MVRMIVVAACSLAVFSATAQDRWVTDDQYAEMQKNFAESNNPKRRWDGCSICRGWDQRATNRYVDSTPISLFETATEQRSWKKS